MAAAGYDAGKVPASSADLMEILTSGVTNALEGRSGKDEYQALSLQDYERSFDQLPDVVRSAVVDRWGAPSDDPHVTDGHFRLALHRFGNQVVGIQPARGYNIDPKETYHDPALVPPHHYFAFYIWLREQFAVDAVIHLGKHGNLEWLPGKALALAESCFPEAVLGPIPNIYPFIVNDPGEGAQAKRRTSAVIVDHLTPPLARAESHGVAEELETLLDEYYLASGVDPRRLKALTLDILDTAARHGLDKDIGITEAMDEETRLARLDAHLCDLKELQIRDGLHILGESPEGNLLTDLLVALARVPRGNRPEQQSLQRAIASDLGFEGFDPLDCDFAAPWQQGRQELLANVLGAPWRSQGDTVERIELLAREIVAGNRGVPEAWQSTLAVLDDLNQVLRPAVTGSGHAETSAVLTALEGGFVAPGPSGAPSRGRPDVLPTGRNFYSVDVRAVPTETAWRLGWQSATLVAERYFQEEGEWPKSLVLTCWGTANMRTGGDDIAQALALIGRVRCGSRVLAVSPGSNSEAFRAWTTACRRYLAGFRVFRDAFPHQMDLFDSAARAVGALEEPEEANPIAARMRSESARLQAEGLDKNEAERRAGFRVFGSKPGAYGAGLQALIDEKLWRNVRICRCLSDMGWLRLRWRCGRLRREVRSRNEAENRGRSPAQSGQPRTRSSGQ